MVGFRDLVGVGIAPVSKKPAVKWEVSRYSYFKYEEVCRRFRESYAKLKVAFAFFMCHSINF